MLSPSLSLSLSLFIFLALSLLPCLLLPLSLSDTHARARVQKCLDRFLVIYGVSLGLPTLSIMMGRKKVAIEQVATLIQSRILKK